MKTKEVSAIARQLLPDLPGFMVKGKMLFYSPVGDVLRGMYFEGSSDPQKFYLRVLFLPLFVPHEIVTFTHGERIGNALKWRMDSPDLLADLREIIGEKAMSFLERVSTLDGVIEEVMADVKRDWPRVNSHHEEALACALVRKGDYQAGLEWFVDQKQRLADSHTPWIVAQYKRAELMEQKLLQSPEAAVQQLEVWKAQTIANLGLEKYRA